MGISSIWHWVLVLVIVVIVFGTKKLRNVGEDLGSAVKGFREGMREGTESKAADDRTSQQIAGQTIEGEAKDIKDTVKP